MAYNGYNVDRMAWAIYLINTHTHTQKARNKNNHPHQCLLTHIYVLKYVRFYSSIFSCEKIASAMISYTVCIYVYMYVCRYGRSTFSGV